MTGPAAPSVPVRSEAELAQRSRETWRDGMVRVGSNAQDAAVYLRRADGARVVLLGPSLVRDAPTDTLAVPMRLAMDEHEVTAGRFQSFARARKLPPPRHDRDWPKDPSLPAAGVRWDEAALYCDSVGGRLPTVTEWEWALGSSHAVPYPWGRSWPPPVGAGNFRDASWAGTKYDRGRSVLPDHSDGHVVAAPVGSFPLDVTRHGLFDMAGNVNEFLQLESDRLGGPVDGYEYRPVRGASWFTESPSKLFKAGRTLVKFRDTVGGFRCAHDVPADFNPMELPTK